MRKIILACCLIILGLGLALYIVGRDSVRQSTNMSAARDSLKLAEAAIDERDSMLASLQESLAKGFFPNTNYILEKGELMTFAGTAAPLERPMVFERYQDEFLRQMSLQHLIMGWYLRTGRYFPQIEDSLRAYGVPDDFKYLPVWESELKADAVSWVGAQGHFQFMVRTGRANGLVIIEGVYDERRDFLKSLGAACRYLRDAYIDLGDWHLVLASYNCGVPQVKQLVKKYGRDVYRLPLPKQTRGFIFSVPTVKHILSNIDRYLPTLQYIERYASFDATLTKIKVIKKTTLADLASSLGADPDVFSWYNQQLNYWVPAGSYTVNIPNSKMIANQVPH